jgi:hypothetical protein
MTVRIILGHWHGIHSRASFDAIAFSPLCATQTIKPILGLLRVAGKLCGSVIDTTRVDGLSALASTSTLLAQLKVKA